MEISKKNFKKIIALRRKNLEMGFQNIVKNN